MLPIRTDSPLHARPWMNWALIAANVLVMAAERIRPGLLPRYELENRSPDLWRFLTYAFLHVSELHLLANMLFLYLLGNNINDRLGHFGYLGFYLGGAVFAGIGFLSAGGRATVGASGAVGAVMGAFLVLLPRAHIILSFRYPALQLRPNLKLSLRAATLDVRSMYLVVIYFLYNVIMGFALQADVQQVAYEAHVAGMLFGFFVILGLLLVRLLPREQSDFPALVQLWWRRRVYRRLIRNGFDPSTYVPPPAPQAGSGMTRNVHDLPESEKREKFHDFP